MKTVLITGCSSGFGLETALHFLAQDWRVVATMRTPRDELFPATLGLQVLALDVTDGQSIRHAIAAAGEVDVLVNNAGFGAPAPFELMDMETVRALFETNTFGTITMTQAVLPQMRERRSGVIINVTSSATYKPLPLIGAYRAAKAAVNSLTESLAAEIAQFGLRAHLVLPGSSGDTRFRETARAGLRGIDHEVYGQFMQDTIARMAASVGPGTRARDVAQAVWRAATDPTAPLYIPAGADAEQWAAESGGAGDGSSEART